MLLRRTVLWVLGIVLAMGGRGTLAAILDVGPGQPFDRIEAALEKALPGDEIRVHPKPDGSAYDRVALRIRTPRLSIRGIADANGKPVKIDGTGFDYSGLGAVPRAIVQFSAGADGGLLEGFELTGAHNGSHNGAGVRISQASHVTIRRCHIHGNDMGIMSGGDGRENGAMDQRIEYCTIHQNGATEDPGYNHNLYLGGTSVLVQFCDIHSSTTGHNLKSRAHFNWIQYNHIHDAANREVDLVDAADTEREGSHAVLLGNLIRKDPESKGNRTVIHFGQDGGKAHNGTIYLVHNTIITPFIAPVLDLSTPGARAVLLGNVLGDGGVRQANQVVAAARNGAALEHVTGRGNILGRGFTAARGTALSDAENQAGIDLADAFQDPARLDYRPRQPFADIPEDPTDLSLPAFPGDPEAPGAPLKWQYQAPATRQNRVEEQPTPGAFGPADNTRS